MLADRLSRVKDAVVRGGVAGAARAAVDRAAQKVRMHEEHVWYGVLVGDVAAAPPFEAPLLLVKASKEDLDRVEQLGRSAADAAQWHAAGHDLWLVLDGDDLAFSCWNFRGRTPVHAAAGRWLELSDDTICLEDSITAATHRGRGIAPRAWMQIANRVAAEGVQKMITKVEVENVPSRKAVQKASFREVALQTFDRIGPKETVDVKVLDEPIGRELHDRITRG